MFGIGWGEVAVLVVAALFILGPQRLPEAAAWLGRTIRQARHYVASANEQLQAEFGPELEELREPLADLRSLRELNPRRAITRHLFDGYDPSEDLRALDIRDEFRPGTFPAPNTVKPTPPSPVPQRQAGQPPPVDSDAT